MSIFWDKALLVGGVHTLENGLWDLSEVNESRNLDTNFYLCSYFASTYDVNLRR